MESASHGIINPAVHVDQTVVVQLFVAGEVVVGEVVDDGGATGIANGDAGMPARTCKSCLFTPRHAALVLSAHHPLLFNRRKPLSKHAHHVARTGFTAKQLVTEYRRFATRIPSQKFTQQICRDADDDAVLACALAAKAQLIVTGDKDLLVLHPWSGINILNPAEAMQRVVNGTT